MKTCMILAAAAALALSTPAEIFTLDTGHAEIGFSVKHMMVSNTKGSFNTFEGTVDFDLESNTLKAIEGTIQAASIDTNNEKRDEHLRAEDFFNVEKYPTITFKSTTVKKQDASTYEVTGILNMLGKYQTVVLPVTVNGPLDDPRGKKRMGIESETVLNRRELGLTSSPAAVIGDEVKISISMEATM
ncbi:YceI family protein [Pontiella agarivorans]|uniref:YceI family protein n=1 Tax=Pontiella agarivorans TaxID=3038953 RepID=A0ABU5MW71_9BACT|nr:YceI family protein [Pontiella agarivorans]MDZ8118367.1 YceI family protein [Pontiella agarivorans]